MKEIFSLIHCLIVLAVCTYVAGFETNVLVLVLRVGFLVLVLVLRVDVLLTTLHSSSGKFAFVRFTAVHIN